MYANIQQITTCSVCFSTRRIHIGLNVERQFFYIILWWEIIQPGNILCHHFYYHISCNFTIWSHVVSNPFPILNGTNKPYRLSDILLLINCIKLHFFLKFTSQWIKFPAHEKKFGEFESMFCVYALYSIDLFKYYD